MRTKLPRQAGTSVIPAIIFAAVLGVIALGLNATLPNSQNAALSAQAAAATSKTTIAIPACSSITSSPVDVSTDPTGQACVCSQNSDQNGALTTSYYQLDYTVNILNGKAVTTRTWDSTQAPVAQNSQCNVKLCGVPAPIYGSMVGVQSQSNSSAQACTTKLLNPGSLFSNVSSFATAQGASVATNYGSLVSPDNANPGSASPNPNSANQGFTCANGQQADPTTGLCPVGSADKNVPANIEPNTAEPAACQAGSYDATACSQSGYCVANPTQPGCSDTNQPPAPGPSCKTACSAGQVCSNGSCVNSGGLPPPSGPANPLGGFSLPPGLTSGLMSFGSGLIRGFSSPCMAPGQNPYIGGTGTNLVPVTTYNPAVGGYTTTYVQQQTPGYGGGFGYGGMPCGQPAPYGVGNNGLACPQPAPEPSPAQCTVGSWQPTSATGNGCTTGWRCVPNGSQGAGAPSAQLSCSPQVADVGEQISISYSCGNSSGSSGAGFSTNNQTSGTASATITQPPKGDNTASYGLTCTSAQGQTAGQQCSIEINQPTIVMVANPSSVKSGQVATVGWVTAGMQSCIVSSPSDASFTAQNANNTSANGVAQTNPITTPTTFNLVCTTFGGQSKTASTTVGISTATSSATSATSTATTTQQ